MEKVVIRLAGGLGNQLFQISKAYSLVNDLNRLVLITDFLGAYNKKRSPTVLQYFPELNCTSSKKLNRFEYLLFKVRIIPILKFLFRLKKEIILKYNNCIYLDGYYQDSFSPSFVKLLNSRIENIPNNCVSLHVRRDDYITDVTARKVFLLLEIDYYISALDMIKRNLPINVFTSREEDFIWIKSRLDIGLNYQPKDEIHDFNYLVNSSFLVIANSTFSFWAGLVAIERGALVYAPKKWYRSTSKIIPFSNRFNYV